MTERYIDTVEFICSFSEMVDYRDLETRKFIFEKIASILPPVFRNFNVVRNEKTELLAMDENKYCSIIVNRAVNKCSAKVQIKGYFYNVGRFLGIDVMDTTQDVLRRLDNDFNLGGICDIKTKWNLNQFDIKQDFKGYTVESLSRNYRETIDSYNVKNKTMLTWSRVNAMYSGTEDEPVIETVYLNFLKGSAGQTKRKPLVSGKIYNKKKHLEANYKNDEMYWKWYEYNFGLDSDVSRMEMSYRSSRQCSGILEEMRNYNRNGEIIDESAFCLDILSSSYKGNPKYNTSKRSVFKVRMKEDKSLEPVVKFFCTEKGVRTKFIEKPKIEIKNKMKPEELIKRRIKRAIYSDIPEFYMAGGNRGMAAMLEEMAREARRLEEEGEMFQYEQQEMEMEVRHE
mgnify:FL=1